MKRFALTWSNMLPDGTLEDTILHAPQVAVPGILEGEGVDEGRRVFAAAWMEDCNPEEAGNVLDLGAITLQFIKAVLAPGPGAGP